MFVGHFQPPFVMIALVPLTFTALFDYCSTKSPQALHNENRIACKKHVQRIAYCLILK